MKLLLVLGLLAVVFAVKVVKDEGESVQVEDTEKSIVVPGTNQLEKKKKHKCNLEYLACVKKGGGTRKSHLKCGKKFLKCAAKCYGKCKAVYKNCRRHHHSVKECKGKYMKCAHKCPHYNRCQKKCRVTFIKCKKSKGKNCLPNFIACLKKCRHSKENSLRYEWYGQ